MKYKLDNSSQQEVLDQITKLDDSLEDVNIQVKFKKIISLILFPIY
jgi:hypothetical protein